jgi:FKBP-type peptidyl-prolyl cis-trans isomerase FklB
MKFSITTAIGLGLAAATAAALAQQPTAGPAAGLKDATAKASYAIGLSIGRDMAKRAIKIDPQVVAQGLKDGISGGKPQLSDEECQQAINAVFKAAEGKMQETYKELGERNKKEGAAFLAANKTKPGVVTLPSGLQYKVIKEGNGPSPKLTDTVLAHYSGKLLDGTEFDSSYKRGQPLELRVDGVIPGWTEALQKMKPGSKWELFIPSELAYGERPRPGGPIGPNAVLVFQVELVKIQ